MQTLTIKGQDRILIVAPHPDDECIGTGGILACYPELCTVLVLIDGRQGQGDMPPDKEKEIRKKEFLAEMDNLGIKCFQMLEYEDGTLMQHMDCLINIPLSGYTKIFVTGIYDNHPDHTAACMSLYNALHHQKIHCVEVYLYEVHSPMQYPSHMLDISDVMDKKMELIRFHDSQLTNLPYDLLAKSMAEYRAIQNRQQGRYLETYLCRKPEERPEDKTIELEEKLQKLILFYWILTKWVDCKIKGQNIVDVLRLYGYMKIVIYGYAELGQLLCKEILQGGMRVEYVLDKTVETTGIEGLPIYKLVDIKKSDQEPLRIDVVIVTAVYYFEEIKRELTEAGYQNVISMRTLLE